MLDGILIDFDLAPHFFGDFEGLGSSKFVRLLKDALHEDTLTNVGLIVDHCFGEGLTGLVATDTAVHLGQVVGDLEDLFHLAHGD